LPLTASEDCLMFQSNIHWNRQSDGHTVATTKRKGASSGTFGGYLPLREVKEEIRAHLNLLVCANTEASTMT
jgi:hypothetical protein